MKPVSRLLDRIWTRPIVVVFAVPLWLGAAAGDPPRQSLPPQTWDKATRAVFPPHPQSLLRGKRPQPRAAAAPPAVTPGVSPTADPGAFAWSKVISPGAVTNEIKSYRNDVAEQVRNIGVFKSEGHRQLRRHFSMLAAMFGIIAEYDQPIRWKQDAAAARAAFARAAVNAKAADDNTFHEAKARSQNLEDLVRGGNTDFPAPPAGDVSWPSVAERSQLMKRLELAFEKRLRPAVADAATLGKQRDASLHEAEIIAALAEIIGREGYESADDAEYQKHAQDLKHWALAAAAAARDNNIGEAQRAVANMGKSCSECHGAFK